MMPFWGRFRRGAIEALYPRTCSGCGMRGTWLCDACERSVPRLDIGICYRCGGPAGRMCRLCQQLDRSIVRARAVYPYMGWVARAVRTFKYGEEWDRGPDLAARMAPMMRVFGDLDGIVPVPLHVRKLRQRGYNQAEILARALAHELHVPLAPLLQRTRETRPQVELSREERHANTRGAFAVNPTWAPPAGARYVLIDDVRTTGATLNACANALMRTGPAGVYVATLALDIPAITLDPWLDEHAGV